MSLQKFALPLIAAAAVIGLGLTPAMAADKTADAAKSLSKEDVEKIVHDYIVSNPKLILDSVEDYQKSYMEKRAAEGMKKNKDILVADPNAPEAGNKKGDVTVVEFFDYNCHFCKSALPSVQALLEKDKNVRVVFKDFPILGPTSETASKWALAAQKQNKYYPFHVALMGSKEPISDEMLARLAKAAGLDVEKAKADADSSEIAAQLEKNRALAGELGLNGTPAFVIGDYVSRGAIPVEEMQRRISDARADAKKK